MSDFKTIVLCATQRSGSTMICEDMRNSQVLGKPEEYFIAYLNGIQEDSAKEQFERVLNRGCGNNNVRAVKIMANQADKIDICLGGSGSVVGEEKILPAFAKALEGSIFVYIRRRDMIRQAISGAISRRTDICHATAKASDPHFAGKIMKGYDPHYTDKLKYNKAEINTVLDIVKQGNEQWQRFFEDWHITPLILTYEDVVDDFLGYLKALAAEAEIELDPASVPTRRMVKLANHTNEDWYRRYTRSEKPRFLF